MYSGYAQGRNVDNAAGMTEEDRRNALYQAAAQHRRERTRRAGARKIRNLAILPEANCGRFTFTNWAEIRHVSPFRTDAPGDAENTQRLYAFSYSPALVSSKLNERPLPSAGTGHSCAAAIDYQVSEWFGR